MTAQKTLAGATTPDKAILDADRGEIEDPVHRVWEAVEGAARVKLDGAWRDLVPSDGPLAVAPHARHELKNESGRVAKMRTRVTPAGRLEKFLIESARAAREGLYNARNMPTGFRGAAWIAEFALRFKDETVMTSPPPALQRLVLPVVARFARRSG